MQNPHKEHRKRVKEEFRKKGLGHFAPHKMLEMLLYYSISQKDTNVIGHRLIERFDSISGVFDAPIELLTEVKDVGIESATLIKLVSGLISEYMDDYAAVHNSIEDIEAAKEYMRYKFLCRTVECVFMICIGANGKIIYSSEISEGSPETVQISPATVVKTALRANAIKVVLAHNHPGGICNPSTRDMNTTCLLHQELRRVDIELQDHIIVAPDGVYSMREHGMMPR